MTSVRIFLEIEEALDGQRQTMKHSQEQRG
jgi:hypothetical protein